MSAPGIDMRLHLDALTALLTTPLNGHVYEPGAVPGEHGNTGTLPDIFTVLFLEGAFTEPTKASRRAHRSGWRLAARCTGRSYREAAWAALTLRETLEGVRLAVDGHESTPVTHFATGEVSRDADDRHSIEVEFDPYAL